MILASPEVALTFEFVGKILKNYKFLPSWEDKEMSYRSLPLSHLDHLSVPMCAGIGWLESWSRDRCYACERNTVEWESCTDRELHNFNNLKQRPLKPCLQLPAPINDLSTISTTQKQHTCWLILMNRPTYFKYTTVLRPWRIKTHQSLFTVFSGNDFWQLTNHMDIPTTSPLG